MNHDAASTPPLAADKKMDAVDIQRVLLERICLLRYKPDDQLKEALLAAEFGVSRTPVRDALNRISHLGLIESRNGVGTVVMQLSAEQIQHVYEMRLELASLIGRVSPITPGPAHLTALLSLLEDARVLQQSFDPDGYVLINHRLNALIVTMIGNQSLRAMWQQTYFQAASTWYRVAELLGPAVGDTLINELSELIEAVKMGDAEALGYVERVHINYGYTKVKQLFL
ncbi:MAG: GntR family transcriptional regulator [Notoacmeibacter sp.]|nr:GntR family transcriptional regulator [Notoacmeibacter sp.]